MDDPTRQALAHQLVAEIPVDAASHALSPCPPEIRDEFTRARVRRWVSALAALPLREWLAILAQYMDAWHEVAAPRLLARERGAPVSETEVRGPDFESEVLNRAFPQRTTQAQRAAKAMALAPNPQLYWALRQGESVPWHMLDFFAAQRYGLRRRRPDGRYSLDDFNDVPRPM